MLLSCRIIYETLKVEVSLMIAISNKNSRIVSISNIPNTLISTEK